MLNKALAFRMVTIWMLSSTIGCAIYLKKDSWDFKNFVDEAAKQQAICSLSSNLSLNLCIFKTINSMKISAQSLVDKDEAKELTVTKNRVNLNTSELYDAVDQANLAKSVTLRSSTGTSDFTYILCTNFVYSKYINAFNNYIKRFDAPCNTCVNDDKSNRALIQKTFDFFSSYLNSSYIQSFNDNINIAIDQLDSLAKPNFLNALTLIRDLAELDSVKKSESNQELCISKATSFAGDGYKISFDSWDQDNYEEMKLYVPTDKLVWP